MKIGMSWLRRETEIESPKKVWPKIKNWLKAWSFFRASGTHACKLCRYCGRWCRRCRYCGRCRGRWCGRDYAADSGALPVPVRRNLIRRWNSDNQAAGWRPHFHDTGWKKYFCLSITKNGIWAEFNLLWMMICHGVRRRANAVNPFLNCKANIKSIFRRGIIPHRHFQHLCFVFFFARWGHQ